MATKNGKNNAPAALSASRRRQYEYDHEYGLRLKGREAADVPKRRPAPPGKKA